MKIFNVLVISLALGLFFVASVAQTKPSVPDYQLVVNPNNSIAVANREFLTDIFLKKVTTWSNGQSIYPSDLAPNSIVRRRFSEDVLRRSIDSVKEYWQQRIFSGRDVPPPEFDTDEQMVQYVLKYDGAIGYVSGTANLNGLKVIRIQ